MTSLSVNRATELPTETAAPVLLLAADRTGTVLKTDQVLGRYIIARRLGAGGGGVVYLAFDTKLERKVALKLLARHVTNPTALIDEARRVAKVAHPNIVPVYDVDEIDGQIYFAMQYMAGGTLGAWLSQHEVSRSKRLELLASLADAVAVIHEAGLVHSDLKPSNILLDEHGTPKLADFGASIAAAPERSTLVTAAGATPHYAAPEWITDGKTSALADQYSFCLTAYEVCFDTHPLGDATDGARLRRMQEQGFVGPDHGDPRLEVVLARGLRYEPQRRYPTMRALAQALRNVPRRKRRMTIAVASLGLAAAGAILASALAVAPDDGCRDRARARTESAWSSADAAAIESAAQRRPTALWEGVDGTLSSYAESLDRASDQLCQTGASTATNAALSVAQAEACLDLAAVELSTVTEHLIQDAPARPDLALAHLAPPEGCLQEEAAAHSVLPDHAPTRAAVLEGYRALAAARLEALAGRGEPATTLWNEAEDTARIHGDLGLQARVEYRRGQWLAENDGKHRAESQLMAAYGHAVSGQLPWMQALSLVALARLYRHDLAKPREADQNLRLAALASESLGDPRDLTAEIRVEQAAAERDRGAYQHACEILETLDWDASYPDHTRFVFQLRRAHCDHSHALYEALLDTTTRSYGASHPRVADVLESFARRLRRQPWSRARAAGMLRRALVIREDAFGRGSPAVAATLITLAREALRAEEIQASADWLAQIDRSGSGLSDKARLDLLQAEGLLASHSGDHSTALDKLRQVLEQQLQTLGYAHPRLSIIRINLAASYERAGEFDEAERELREAIALPVTGHSKVLLYVLLAENRVAAGDRDERDVVLETLRNEVAVLNPQAHRQRVALLEAEATLDRGGVPDLAVVARVRGIAASFPGKRLDDPALRACTVLFQVATIRGDSAASYRWAHRCAEAAVAPRVLPATVDRFRDTLREQGVVVNPSASVRQESPSLFSPALAPR